MMQNKKFTEIAAVEFQYSLGCICPNWTNWAEPPTDQFCHILQQASSSATFPLALFMISFNVFPLKTIAAC